MERITCILYRWGKIKQKNRKVLLCRKTRRQKQKRGYSAARRSGRVNLDFTNDSIDPFLLEGIILLQMDQYFFIDRERFCMFSFKLKYIGQNFQTGKIILLRTVSFWKMFSAANGALRAWLPLTGGQEPNITKKSRLEMT